MFNVIEMPSDTQSELRGGNSVVSKLHKLSSKKSKSSKNLTPEYVSNEKYAANLDSHGTRAERLLRRNISESAHVVTTVSYFLHFIEEANFVHWSTHEEGCYY